MKYLSVCSGIEAATVAWEPLGFSALAYSEIEAFPSAVLQHHYPNTPNLGDMTKFKCHGKGNEGEKHPMSKLSNFERAAIKWAIDKGFCTQHHAAKVLGMRQTSISNIVNLKVKGMDTGRLF